MGDSLPLLIRQATIDDLETLCSIERECFTLEAFTKDQMRYLLENPKGISLIAQTDNEIAGFIVGIVCNCGTERIGDVYTLDVAAKHRRKGIGLRLLRELEQRFAHSGIEACVLEARAENAAALELYQKEGYVKVHLIKDLYSNGIDGIRLMKKLAIPQ